jgi:hypothetical protein
MKALIAAQHQRRSPQTAPENYRMPGVRPHADLPIDPDGAASIGAYRGAMLTPKVTCVTSMPTAHPSATRPAASARQAMAAPARR